jgi:hypothetical protein
MSTLSRNENEARIADLELQLAAVEEENERLHLQMAALNRGNGLLIDLGAECESALAAARSDAVKAFAEWLDAEHDSGINTVWYRDATALGGRVICAVRDAARRYLAQFDGKENDK